VHFEYPLLLALAAVVREGTFEAAARSLNITQSAVSQRVKLLEEKTGAVLIVRGRPCVATEFGQQLYRHVEQVQLLEHDLRNKLTLIEDPSSAAPALVRIAVNNDSLATWFPEVILRAGSRLNVMLDIFPDDQAHTAEKLRSGEALAVVTAEGNPLHGCRRLPLGAIEFVAIASPQYLSTRLQGRVTIEAVSRAAHLAYNRKDTLPQQWLLSAFGESAPLTCHFLPSITGHLACCLNGAGWGLMPRFSVEAHLQDGALVELAPGRSVLVPLYWQSSAEGSEVMRALSSIVAEVARKYLLPLPHEGLAPAGAARVIG